MSHKIEKLKMPCGRCGRQASVIYLPAAEVQRYEREVEESQREKAEYFAKTGERLRVTPVSEMHLIRFARWHIHCSDHQLDSADMYWFDVDRADTWEKLIGWCAQMGDKNWFAGTDWSDFLRTVMANNGGMSV